MAVQSANISAHRKSASVPYIDQSFDVQNSEVSLLNLVYWIRPKWRDYTSELKITKFTDGITNTLLMVARHTPGASQDEIDADAVLMRAYGNGTDVIIDRDREAISHGLLAQRGMAPPLLARFKNGLLYSFVAGKVCKAQDLAREPVWRGVAQKLGEWHAIVPISGISSHDADVAEMNGVNGTNGHVNGDMNGGEHLPIENGLSTAHTLLTARRPVPNLWSVMQKWVDALSVGTEKERARKAILQQEVLRSFQELDSNDGIGDHGFVFAHCDLLCGNVIEVQIPEAPSSPVSTSKVQPVAFIDYEYATPAPAAFDISNHFAEWAGYDCDYSMVPTRSVRRGFIREYLASYAKHSTGNVDVSLSESLFQLVERWRGIPGLYWGIWALIQAKISEIDFDYATYAEERLGEYFAWRNEADGSRARQGKQMPLRERRWAED